MKCIFTTNSKSDLTFPLLKVAINSLKKNTTLEPVVVWGDHIVDTNEMVNWLIDNGVQIVYHKLFFEDRISHFDFKKVQCDNEMLRDMYLHYPEYYNWKFIYTESLRIDIPRLFPNEKYVMYADCDTLFLKDINVIEFDQPLAAVTRDGFFNNGIMVLNIEKMMECYTEFVNFYVNSSYRFSIGNTTSQGAYNTFFHRNVHSLPLEMNWFPFWDMSKDHKEPNIVHFVGPKPNQYLEMWSAEKCRNYEGMYHSCGFGNKDNIKYWIREWNTYV
jgi:lipopolysaccharide biosynthesis glycosyltransferase